jgi:hypothetical protein
MAYGTIKVDTITFTDGGVDKSVSISGLVENPTFTGNVTATGTISGDILRGQTISGVTVTGTTAQFTSGTFTSLTGVTVTGTTANFTSGNFTNISGGTHTITSGVFALGTAANPSISFVSDPNSGLYSPGADQVAISTNGTGRVFVDANGNVNIDDNSGNPSFYVDAINNRVGIGVNSPLQTLHISAASPPITQITYQGVGAAQVGVVAGGAFTVGLDGGNGSTERMRLDSSGRLGLGTSSPSAKLDVWPATSDAAFRGNSGISVQVPAFEFIGYNTNTSNGGLDIRTNLNGTFTDKVRVTNDGLVGIGITSPAVLLDLKDSVGDCVIGLTGATSARAQIRGINTGSSTSSEISFQTTLAGSTGERARIDSSGRLLVGTSTSLLAYAKLQVQGGAGTDPGGHICLANENSAPTNGSNIGSVRFTNNAGGIGAVVGVEADGAWTAGSNYRSRLVFSTTADGASSPTERMRITQAGNFIFKAAGYIEYGDYGTPNSGNPGIRLTGDQYPQINISSGYFGDTGSRTKMEFINGNGTVGTIVTNGSATAYNTSSDYRLKENVVSLTGAADRLKLIPVHRFNFIADPSKTVDGFIAHEAQAVVPECVTGTKDEVDDDGNPVYQGIDQSKLVPLLTAALQEALQKIEDLEGRLTAAGI